MNYEYRITDDDYTFGTVTYNSPIPLHINETMFIHDICYSITQIKHYSTGATALVKVELKT